MKIRYIFLICLLKQFIFLIKASDVLGCGGFIKSHVPIDFSKIEVKLVTKQGIVKDRTNCAPNNGYYFIPLYDKGELKLELSPPPGWSFTPNEVSLNIDQTDPCSLGKDINFVFEGFGITGKVDSLRSSTGGPQGIMVTLLSEEGVRTTLTHQDGVFSFSPVFPGFYTVSISHSKWKIYKESVKVEVKEGNTELPKNSLTIQGYDVTGKIVTANGNPVHSAIIALFAEKSDKNIQVEGCEKKELPMLHSGHVYLCYMLSNSLGEFVFPVVPVGNYIIAPYFKEENIDFFPEKIPVSVEHGSVHIKNNFQVIGFTVPGRVTNGKNEPIPNAKILLNGKEITVTDKDGKYKLEKLKVGTYRLTAQADKVKFEEIMVNIDTNVANIPDLVPSAFKICGKVISDKPQTVSFTKTGTTRIFHAVTNEYQEFCQYLPFGHYEVSVTVDTEGKDKGIQFFPLAQKIEVISGNIINLIFSQLKSSISGKVECIEKRDCEGLNVILKSGKDELIIPLEDSVYSENDMHPGVYEVSLSENNLCWQSNKQVININSETVTIPTFIQTGYRLQFSSLYETKLKYRSKGRLVELSIARGITTTCLEAPGQYTLTLNSCHEFESDRFTYNTYSDKSLIELVAQKHTVELFIQSDKDHGPIEVRIQIGDESYRQNSTYSKDGYEVRLMLKPRESAVITPKSNKLFFSPPSVQIEGTHDCENFGNKFIAVMGKVFQGQIKPALSGVRITVEDLSNNEIYTQETDSNGTYKFIPMNSNFDYKVSAQKDSYIFSGPDSSGTFFAQKLAEIAVKVLDEDDKTPLAGVLLSLSGGHSFRRNLQTDSAGSITFHSLSSGDYFLRPLMKEYRFEPASKLITVHEGQTIDVPLSGKRVAFSAFGKLMSVNEDPVEGVTIIAAGVENCTGISEEATTDSSGLFRIRGLQPFCTFNLHVQGGSDQLSLVERTSPESIELKSVNEDVKDLRIIVFRPVLITDVLLKVFAENTEHYRFLKVVLHRESPNPAVIHFTALDSYAKIEKNRNYGILVHLPSLKLDNTEYSLHLEPAQSLKAQSQVVYFKADSSFKYIEMHFNIKTNIKEQPIKQSSIWAMFFILFVIFSAYNIHAVLDLLKQHLNFNIESFSSYIPLPNSSRSMNDYDNDIDQIVQDINNVRKHRPKKTN